MAFYTGALMGVVPRAAEAKVDPLYIIKRQIHKANMLVVLDTSGSMTGVPGGQFAYNTEAGVDCDNGTDCRDSGTLGKCTAQTTLSCFDDFDCRRQTCSLTGDPCLSDADCPGSPTHCALTGQPCAVDADCPAASGTCSATSVTCSSSTPCAVVKQCTLGSHTSCNSDTDCPDPGTCAANSHITCSVNPSPACPSGNRGTCTRGSTPFGGCASDCDCPKQGSSCSITADRCCSDANCPRPTWGTCSGHSSWACNDNTDCWSGFHYYGPCAFPGQTCNNVNVCIFAQGTCNITGDNKCQTVTNTCNVPTNTCVAGQNNHCQAAAYPNDTCGQGAGGTPGPMRMCQITQVVCTANSQCTTAGDSCVPATSRMVMAKRALTTVVSSNYDVVNFGFMTFYQSNYFPYYPNSGGASTVITEFEQSDALGAAGCLNADGSPKSACAIGGVARTLATTPNSRYQYHVTGSQYGLADQDYCGAFCDVPNVGTGIYQGSYYQYNGTVSGNNGTRSVQSAYTGKNITLSGSAYTYYQSNPRYYNGGTAPPIGTASCGNSCASSCGGRWDTQLAPFLDTTDNLTNNRNATLAILARLEKASFGGLISYWNTPTGCTLENTGAQDSGHSAYHYMQAVKAADTVSCRNNYVLLVTDGAANGPGDVDGSGNTICDTAACANANPQAAGCQCKSVLAAYHMKQNLGVKTFVVGFAGDVAAGPPRLINDNIALAGGTDDGNDGMAPYAFLAQNQQDLEAAIQNAIYIAIKGNYSTSPSTSSSGTQGSTVVNPGKYALDSTVDFPSWQGHLLAYDVTGTTPSLAWDAYTKVQNQNWWERNIFTWDGTTIIKVLVDATTKAVTNKSALHTMGLGASDAEAEKIARWMMGDPTFKNPTILGAIINSTPIDVGQPGDNPLPGGHDFYNTYKTRPSLTYVGSSDGMLHAFFTDAVTLGSTTYPAGSEAFAFLPPDMLTHVENLYAQGGQLADPNQHLYGLADSPKVKNICMSGCDQASTAVWKTVMMMTEGYGGPEAFMLDVTAPFSATALKNQATDPPFRVLWHTGYGSGASTYNSSLGLTLSLPAFYLNKTDPLDDYGVVFASGYKVDANSTTQGKTIVRSQARDGTVLDTRAVTPVGSCAQEFALLADVGTARDFAKNQVSKLLAAYYGDTWGTLWRYTVGGGVSSVVNLDCNQPLHFAPTVVQLDRDDPNNHTHEIYLVQVTNSALDADTAGFPASQMVFTKDTADGFGAVTPDPTFGSSGKIVLTAGGANMCGVTSANGSTCTTPLPATARPMGTPLGILKKDGSGFQTLSLWYVPAPDGCTKGTTYFLLHDMTSGAVTEKQGFFIANEPVPPPAVVGGKIFVITSGGASSLSTTLSQTFSVGSTTPVTVTIGGYNSTGWQELP